MSTNTPNVEDLLAKLHADKLYVMPMLTFRAERLDSEALYQIGLMYYQSTNRDFKDAIPWFHLSSSRNYSKASYQLGVMYYKGCGVERDYLMSLEWHLKCAKSHKDSRLRIAYLFYRGGDGIPQDDNKALAWFYRYDPESRMVRHMNKERHVYLKEHDKYRPFSELYKEAQNLVNIEKGKREKKRLELPEKMTGNKDRKPTRDQVNNMVKCKQVFTKKEMKQVFNPFFFHPKRK